MKIQYYTASTLNGFLAGEGHDLEWLMNLGEVESMKDHYPNFIAGIGALAMGANTYQWVVNHEKMLDHPDKWFYRQPCWVFTHRDLPAVPGADIRFTSAPVSEVHAAMAEAAGGKNLWVVGGGELAGQFLDAGLLDELIITFAPVLLESGFPLLPRKVATPPLKLLKVESFGEVFATLTYGVRKGLVD